MKKTTVAQAAVEMDSSIGGQSTDDVASASEIQIPMYNVDARNSAIGAHDEEQHQQSPATNNNNNNNNGEANQDNTDEAVIDTHDKLSMKKETPMPRKKVFVSCLFIFTDGFNMTSLFPYVGFMIVRFKLSSSTDSVGYYAGLLASSYFLAQFLSSFIWGRISDKIGRRPVLLIGSLGSFISVVLFGFSKNYAWAMICRFLAGLLNGNIGIVKTYLGEVTDVTNSARAFSYIGLFYGLGTIVGPMCGGLLSEPADKYGRFVPGIFATFPFLLPNLFCGVVTLIGFITGYFFLTETLQQVNKKDASGQQQKQELNDENNNNNNIDNGDNSYNGASKGFFATIKGKFVTKKNNRYSKMDEEGELELADQDDTPLATSDGNSSALQQQQQQQQQQESGSTSVTTTTTITMTETQQEPTSNNDDSVDGRQHQHQHHHQQQQQQKMTTLKALTEKTVLLACGSYAMLGFANTIYNEVFPLWTMVPPKDGGLGFGTSQIGYISSIAGIYVVLFQLFINPPLTNWLGLLRSFKVGVVLYIPTLLLTPLVNVLAPRGVPSPAEPEAGTETTNVSSAPAASGSSDGGGGGGSSMIHVWIALIIVTLLRNTATQLCFTSVARLINHSSHPAYIGSANGLGQSLVSFVRAVGPSLGGAVLAWSVSTKHPFPFNHHFTFWFLAVVLVLLLILSTRFPESINFPKKFPEQQQQQRQQQP